MVRPRLSELPERVLEMVRSRRTNVDAAGSSQLRV